MSFNGSGTFVINSTGNPVVTGTTISSTWANALTADLATGLSTCVTKDGQQTTTAIVPFAAGINVTATASSFYIVGTATFTLTGCTTAPTYLGKYTILGNVVTLTFPGTSSVSGTSNAATKTLTGMPSALFPSATIKFPMCFGTDNGTGIFTGVSITSAGVITFGNGATAPPTSFPTGGYTGSGAFLAELPLMSWTIA